MNCLLTASYSDQILLYLLAIVGILLGIAWVVAVVLKAIVAIRYQKSNHTPAKNGLTGEQTARLLLDNLGLQDVQIKKLNWFSGLIYGNNYNAKKKTIYIRSNISNKSTVTAIGISCQKVGLAILDHNGDKTLKIRSSLQPFVVLAPILFVPMALVGLFADLFLFDSIGVLTAIFIGMAFLYYILAFIVTLLNIPVENRGNKLALELMEKTNFLDEEERVLIEKVFKSYKLSYIADFILALLYIIKMILKILIKIKK